jgi:hypothetical protein
MKTTTCFILFVLLCSFKEGRQYHNDENPAIYLGTTFGHYFQVLYRQGRYTEMLEVTSSTTIKKFGRDRLLRFFEEMDFSYRIKLKSLSETTLFYETKIFGTKRTLKFHYCIENGKCKVVFQKLDPKNPFG